MIPTGRDAWGFLTVSVGRQPRAARLPPRWQILGTKPEDDDCGEEGYPPQASQHSETPAGDTVPTPHAVILGLCPEDLPRIVPHLGDGGMENGPPHLRFQMFRRLALG